MSYDSDNSLKLYLREIGKTPLLTLAEETALAERIKMGDKEARTQMIQANLRFVVKIAQDYSGYGLSLGDLISEGNIGLMHAVERFDPEKGGKLSTYGAWWIKQSIKRALGVCLTYNFTQNQHVESSALANTVYGSRFSQVPESDEFGATYLLSWRLTTTT